MIEKSSHEKAGADQALTPDQHVTKSLEIIRHMRARRS
jgi:hypothetical protein